MLEVDLTLRLGAFEFAACFNAPSPGVTALFGRSGAGKTTLANAIAGLVQPQAGRIRLDGEVLYDRATGIDLAAERRRIGYVFQNARLFPHLSVAGNLDYGARRAVAGRAYARRDEVVELLGLESLLARGVARLSGGERQRVALGRALLAQPRLLLLDEPLAAVDVQRRAEVLPFLETLRDRFSIPMLYVSHQYDEVLRLANYIVLLDAGRVLASGTPSELAPNEQLRALIGVEAAGAVLDVAVEGSDSVTGLVTVGMGASRLHFALPGATPGARVRLYIPARDVILATHAPHGLSVRNAIRGTITALIDEGPDAVLASVQVDGACLQAWVTRAAVTDLGLRPGLGVWALVKAASLRGRAFGGRSHAQPGLPES
jgi:molybdate transport system ATP-binding protein